ncbi:MAG: DMT family transporter [Candidatus Aminicenantes bacterium]|nr:DMT family transporter [Candidatus Aminicenantes bacterium]
MNCLHQGEILSVISALAWAVAVILFRISGQKISPLALNLFKSTLASFLLLFSAWIFFPENSLINFKSFILLIISGFFGIALSDTLFFICLNNLGASITAIVECLYSPFVIALSILFLGETIKERQLVGVGLILAAIIAISWPHQTKFEIDQVRAKAHQLISGIIAGTLSMLFTAVGIVMIKPLLSQLPIFWVAAIRMTAGALFLWLALLCFPSRKKILQPLFISSNWGIMTTASLIGAYGGIIAWVAGMKYTAASIAASLNQLNTVFIFGLAVLFLKERINLLRFLAFIVALVGAFLASWA